MKTTNINKNNKTRNTIITAMLVLIFCASAAGAAAFASRWFNKDDKTDNTVTVDQPVSVSVSGTAAGGIIMPGVETNKVAAEFDISISGDTAQQYKLVIKEIKFEFDAGIIGNERSDGYFADKDELEALFGAGYTDFTATPDVAAFEAFLKEFQVSFNGGAAAALTEGMVLEASAVSATNQTVVITATDDLLLIARGGTLSFTLALEIA